MEVAAVFWGAFDLATSAHFRIITVCLEKFPIDPLIIVVNNHSYKQYKFSLEVRMQRIWGNVSTTEQKRILLTSQDDCKKMGYEALVQITQKPLYAIAGYDAYRSWNAMSLAKDRALYHKILVIPRGNAKPHLFDAHAELLPIESCYRYVSSSSLTFPYEEHIFSHTIDPLHLQAPE